MLQPCEKPWRSESTRPAHLLDAMKVASVTLDEEDLQSDLYGNRLAGYTRLSFTAEYVHIKS